MRVPCGLPHLGGCRIMLEVAATNALMATLSSTFGRVAVTMRETSAKLATTSERIKNAVPARRTA